MPLKVIIVDDEQDIRDALLVFTTGVLGCHTIAVADANAALAAVTAFKPDLIITDFRMPGMNGNDLIREVKAIMPHVTIVMMSASTEIKTAVEAMKLGADDYLTKPFNLDRIETLVNEVRAKRDRIRTLEQMEQSHIESVIAQYDTLQEAAEKLGINTSTIWRKRKKAA